MKNYFYKYPLLLLLGVYFLLSITTLILWEKSGNHIVTGDEPHYLVMASAIGEFHTLEQTDAYKKEFQTKKIYPHGLAPQNEQPTPLNTHAVEGPNGLFNVHSIGLPLLITIPFLIGGVVGVKLFMIIISSGIIILSWRILNDSKIDLKSKFLITLLIATITPIIPASNQIFPDMPAGLIILLSIYYVFKKTQNSITEVIILSLSVAFLPWLQIKFSVICSIIFVIIFFKNKAKLNFENITHIIIASISAITLFVYNKYAFGNIFGPYGHGTFPSVEFSEHSLMTFFGLIYDQNQGVLFQNLIYLVCVVSLGLTFKKNKRSFLIIMIIYISSFILNALHPNWYGGFSISGRFSWSFNIAIIFSLITYLIYINEKNKNIFYSLISIGLVLNIYYFIIHTILDQNLYNRTLANTNNIFLETPELYSIYYSIIGTHLPQLYNVENYKAHVPNLIWAFIILTLFLLGYLENKKRILLLILFLLFPLTLVNKKTENTEFVFEDLPKTTGSIINDKKIADPNIDTKGYISYGPYIPLNYGTYELIIDYISENGDKIANVEIYNTYNQKTIDAFELPSTNNEEFRLKKKFNNYSLINEKFEFRIYWHGISRLELHNLRLIKK